MCEFIEIACTRNKTKQNMNEYLLANDIKVVINKRQLKNNHQIVTKTKLLPGRDKAILTIVTFEAVIKHEINRKKAPRQSQ